MALADVRVRMVKRGEAAAAIAQQEIRPDPVSGRDWLVWLYATALCMSAFLLMWMEPLFTKMVLPRFGGSSAVWNTAMMFYQVVLLAGYGYAHLLRRAQPRGQMLIHGAILLAAVMFLPFAIDQGWSPPTDRAPVLSLIWLLTITIGLPFFALSASAPLLQVWFATSRARSAHDPYFLYAASNAGSLLALFAFPLLFEPTVRAQMQSHVWSFAYLGLIAFVSVCALQAAGRAEPRDSASVISTEDSRPGWQQTASWIALAAVPSSLLLGVTSYITTDLASVPLLWVMPLALYLLSFIIAFSERRPVARTGILKAEALALVLVSILILLNLTFSLTVSIAPACLLHLGTFFLVALVCHTELADRRPNVQGLTQYYFCLSLGGAIGGVFNALLAPLIFSSIYEYYLALGAACGLRQLIGRAPRASYRDLVAPTLLAAAVGFATYRWTDASQAPNLIARTFLLMSIAAILYSCTTRPIRFALGVLAVAGTAALVNASTGVLLQQRSFYGVLRVRLRDQGRQLALFHGTTSHGAEFVEPARRREPLTYYFRSGPVGQAFQNLGDVHNVGVIGLGTGALACYAQPGQTWTFFEIDSKVEQVARDQRYFHYLEDCGSDAKVVLGDGRLSIRKSPDHYYDLIIIDAFSSDSIPVHLLTREAVALYLSKLSDHGVLLLHISNMSLELAPVVANIAGSLGVPALDQLYNPTLLEANNGATSSEWVALARGERNLAPLMTNRNWRPLASSATSAPWTDDFSNIVSAIKW